MFDYFRAVGCIIFYWLLGSLVKVQVKDQISIVVPAYKAEKIVGPSLVAIENVLKEYGSPYEIICVVDGKVDNTMGKAKEKASSTIKVVGYEANRGKGHAVRFGMARSKGEIVGLMDVGLDINPRGLIMALEHMKWYQADIIVGSKRHPVSKVYYPWQRRILSLGYQMGVRILFGLNVRDTQVGMKLFKRKVVEAILPRLLIKTWAFDVEMLAVARHLGFKKLYESPVELVMEYGGASTLTSQKFLKTIWSMAWDTIAVFYRLHILHYYETSNRKNWIRN